jgi:hypothetical protein
MRETQSECGSERPVQMGRSVGTHSARGVGGRECEWVQGEQVVGGASEGRGERRERRARRRLDVQREAPEKSCCGRALISEGGIDGATRDSVRQR